ncbi:MAG TPA: TlpA disulfide reductase family protein [Phycisphaerales bacterium]|nr:TlpA disulfide reductase family protein [Phycisphaerales bacterium]
MMSRTWAVALGVFIAGAGQAWGQDETVLRESVGSRAQELGEMELQPFDSSLWASLDGWTNGSALDAAATDGKVVLIGTWASWNPASTRMLGTMQSLKEQYGEQGLLVVGVHHPQGWDGAADTLAKRKADFLAAHDTSGKFREGIRSDQEPDFYLIDRAGQLRFADIRNESIEDGVKLLLAEDAASAGSIVSRLEEQARQREVEFAKPKLIHEGVDLKSLPEVPFADPPAEAYQAANWPAMTSDQDERRSGRDEEREPRSVGLPASGWLSGTAPIVRGRAVAYYTFTLEDARSSELCRRMDRLQRQLGRDVVVVGVLTLPESRGRRDEDSVDESSLPDRAARFRTLHDIGHAILIDPSGSVMEEDGGRSRSDKGLLSRAMVVSSDGMLRWSGPADQHAFRAAIDRVVEIDPGVQARRRAEATFIRAKGG